MQGNWNDLLHFIWPQNDKASNQQQMQKLVEIKEHIPEMKAIKKFLEPNENKNTAFQN